MGDDHRPRRASGTWRRTALGAGPSVARALARAAALAAVCATLVAASLAATPASLAAQRRGVDIRLPPASALSVEGPLVRAVGVLDERELRDLLGHGFPIRLNFRAELWTVAGWFNDLRGTWAWDVVLRQEPLTRGYEVARLVGDQVTPLGTFAQIQDAVAAAERPYRVPIVAPRGRRSYWNVVIDVETLSLTDVNEVERWLRGELRPAVRGQRNIGTALGRGLRELASRMLGGETRHYEVRSETFRP